jgi:hypothetical protein
MVPSARTVDRDSGRFGRRPRACGLPDGAVEKPVRLSYDGFSAVFSKRRAREDTMAQLFIALACYALIWFVVLWGSRYFGPKEH